MPPRLTRLAARVRDDRPIAVEVLACGSTDHGDDGAPIRACDLLAPELPRDVRVRKIGKLAVDDLLSITVDAGVVIVDAAAGIDVGAIVELPLQGLIGQEESIRPRSSHVLALPEVVGVVDMVRGRPLRGRIVAVGGVDFGAGHAMNPRVAKALGGLSQAVLVAVDDVRPSIAPASNTEGTG